MTWVREGNGKPPKHKCAMPEGWTAKPLKSVWECACGRQWVVKQYDGFICPKDMRRKWWKVKP